MPTSSILAWVCLILPTPGAEAPGKSTPAPTTTWTHIALGNDLSAPPAKVAYDVRVEVEVTAEGLLFVSFGDDVHINRNNRFVLQSGTTFDLASNVSLKSRCSMAWHPELKPLVIEMPSQPSWDQMLYDPLFGKDGGVGCITINGK